MNQPVGRYQILNELGRGATGIVYKALDPTIGRTIAVKSIPLSEVGDPEEKQLMRERLLREAQSAGGLSHPNIVTIYDILESPDFIHILMEYIEGDSLGDLQRSNALPSHRELWQFLRQIADALDYAHRKGIIHRDIKPANILISKQQPEAPRFAKIADFGIASFVSHDPLHNGAQAGKGAAKMIGTPNYMSPEQIQGLTVGGASDQFALGAVVYELLSGERPFTADGLPSLFYQICKQNSKPVERVNPSLSTTVGKVMARVLAKEPADRFATCSDFIGALSIGLSESPEWLRASPNNTFVAVGPGAAAAAAGATSQAGTHTILNVDPPAVVKSALDKNSGPDPVPPVETTAGPAAPLSGWERIAQRDAAAQAREENSGRGKFWLIVALCAAVGAAALFIVRWNSAAVVPVQVLDTKAGPASPPPADPEKTTQRAPADLSPAPAASAPVSKEPEPAPAPKREAKANPPPAQPATDIVAASQAISDVELTTDPPGAKITIDANPLLICTAPCSLNLPGGRHTLLAELNGYAVMRKIFNAPVNDNVFVSLERNTGVLFLTTAPSGSAVSVDGRAAGKTPLRLTLPAGSHRLTLFDGAQRRHDETIEIDPDGMLTRSFTWQ